MRGALRRDTDRPEMNETDLPDHATSTPNRSRLDHLGCGDRRPTQSAGACHPAADRSERPGQLGEKGI